MVSCRLTIDSYSPIQNLRKSTLTGLYSLVHLQRRVINCGLYARGHAKHKALLNQELLLCFVNAFSWG